MRKLLLALFIMISLVGVPPTTQPAAAQTNVATILAQYPQGGPGLRAAIASFLEQHPDQARAVIAAAAAACAAQQQAIGGAADCAALQQAIGAGFADASLYFAKIGSTFAMEAQAELLSALASAADDDTLALLAAAFTATIESSPSQTLYTTILNSLGSAAPVPGCTGNVHCVSQ
jgi:hypothetical protein